MLDRIVAIVDTGVVLQSEVDVRLADIVTNARRSGQPEPDLEEIYDDVLEALVLENLQMQIAERINIRFDDDTINRVLGSMAENSNMSFDQYVTTLEQAGVYLQTREQVRKQMTLQELQRGLVNQRIRITDQEIENFINSEMGQELMQADYFLNHLVVPFGAGGSRRVASAENAIRGRTSRAPRSRRGFRRGARGSHARRPVRG